MNALKSLATAFAGLCIFSQVFASEFFVLPKNDRTGVYRNELQRIYEEPVFYASTSDVLVVLQTGRSQYLVRNGIDKKGWIEKQACVRAPRGARLIIDTAVINSDWEKTLGFFNIPGDTIISDDPIALDRSFKTEMLANIVKEELARSSMR